MTSTYFYVKIILYQFLFFVYSFLDEIDHTDIKWLFECLKIGLVVEAVYTLLFTPSHKISENKIAESEYRIQPDYCTWSYKGTVKQFSIQVTASVVLSTL